MQPMPMVGKHQLFFLNTHLKKNHYAKSVLLILFYATGSPVQEDLSQDGTSDSK